MFVIDPNKIKKHRITQALTQMELAVEVGTSPAYISRFENAKCGTDCSIDFAMRLAKAMGCKVENIVCEI